MDRLNGCIFQLKMITCTVFDKVSANIKKNLIENLSLIKNI